MSPSGGSVAIEPRSLKFPSYDRSAKAWHADPERMALLEDTASPDDVDAADYDAIYFTGGHAVMYDFPDNEGLQRLTREIWRRAASSPRSATDTAAAEHATLRRLPAGGRPQGHRIRLKEEVLAGVDKLVPYNAEEEMKSAARGTRRPSSRSPPTPSSTDASSPGRNPDRRRRPRRRSPRCSDTEPTLRDLIM